MDRGFGVTSPPNNVVNDVVVDADGTLVLVGLFTSLNGRANKGIVRLRADGAIDPRFDTTTVGVWNAYKILPQEDGRWLLYGGFTNLGDSTRASYLGRLLADGGFDRSFERHGEFFFSHPQPTVLNRSGTLVLGDSYTGLHFFGTISLPVITRQPVGQTVIAGEKMVLSVSADATPAPSYQWYCNGVAIVGATGPTCEIPRIELSQTGDYSVVVYNSVGSIRSQVAMVRVTLAPPKILAGPQNVSVAVGASVTLDVRASGSGVADYQWYRDGQMVPGATAASYTIAGVSLSDAGRYSVSISDIYGSTTSLPAIVAVTIPGKLSGTVSEAGVDIAHPNGNVYDQMQLTGGAAAVRADAGQVVRTSFVDLSDDIVQVEFAGAGTLTITLENATGPAAPTNYNQAVNYMKGHARIVVAGADETTNLSVFSVGRFTAMNQTLFKDSVSYDGHADLASISILSANGKFGGLRTSNASYFATAGLTGVYAPGVTFTGPVFIGELSASDAAQPVIRLGAASDVRITGGDLAQANGAAVDISGITQLKFTSGQDSHGRALPAQMNKAKFTENGVEVTNQIVLNPGS